MKSTESQASGLKNEAREPRGRGTGRTRTFAIVVYPDSAPDDWQERLVQEHVQALISPLHDRDVDPDGAQKKPHWHVLIMFDGVKTDEQADELLDRVLGPNRVKHYENVNSTRGYARYLTHKDNPEKAQYDDADVIALGGADYEALVQIGSDDRSALRMVYAFIRERQIRYFNDLIDVCIDEGLHSMFALVTERRTMAVTRYLEHMERKRKDEAQAADQAAEGKVQAISAELTAQRQQHAEFMAALQDKLQGLALVDQATGEVVIMGKELESNDRKD